MKISGFLLAVLVLAPVCLASPGVGEFFEKLFGVFHPEGIVVTDAPDNATDSASNDTIIESVTETVITELDNDTEVIHAKLTSVVVESLIESDEATTEATTDEDTTSSSTPSTTTTVVYKLFHPNTTTTASSTTTTATTESTENATQHLTESTKDTTGTTTTASPPEGRAAALSSPLSSTTIVDNVLCKTTYNAAANLKITSCGDTTTPKAHSKRSVDLNVDAFPLADTIQNSSTLDESYPSGSEVGDDDGDVFPSYSYGEYESVSINTYG